MSTAASKSPAPHAQQGSQAPATPAPAVVQVTAPVVLRGVRYRDYVAIRDEPNNDHLRMTYHDGTLEIMSPEGIHELPSRRIGVFVSVLCEEMRIEFQGLGCTTFRRGEKNRKKGKGKEPDQCFFFANAAKILGVDRFDLERDPPPDIWVEVDDRSSSAGRLPVYAALGVPEVWQLRAASGRLRFLRLAPDGKTYEPVERSPSLPMLTPELVLEGLALGANLLEMSWTVALRAWVREKFAIRKI
jgi:Uma2 family endonuclease